MKTVLFLGALSLVNAGWSTTTGAQTWGSPSRYNGWQTFGGVNAGSYCSCPTALNGNANIGQACRDCIDEDVTKACIEDAWKARLGDIDDSCEWNAIVADCMASNPSNDCATGRQCAAEDCTTSRVCFSDTPYPRNADSGSGGCSGTASLQQSLTMCRRDVVDATKCMYDGTGLGRYIPPEAVPGWAPAATIASFREFSPSQRNIVWGESEYANLASWYCKYGDTLYDCAQDYCAGTYDIARAQEYCLSMTAQANEYATLGDGPYCGNDCGLDTTQYGPE